MTKNTRSRLAHTISEIRTLNDLQNLTFDLDYLRLCDENYEATWLDARIIEAIYGQDGSALYDIRQDLLRLVG